MGVVWRAFFHGIKTTSEIDGRHATAQTTRPALPAAASMAGGCALVHLASDPKTTEPVTAIHSWIARGRKYLGYYCDKYSVAMYAESAAAVAYVCSSAYAGIVEYINKGTRSNIKSLYNSKAVTVCCQRRWLIIVTMLTRVHRGPSVCRPASAAKAAGTDCRRLFFHTDDDDGNVHCSRKMACAGQCNGIRRVYMHAIDTLFQRVDYDADIIAEKVVSDGIIIRRPSPELRSIC